VISRISWSLKSYKYIYLKTITSGHRIANYDCMLKILRFDDNGSRVVALSGRIEERYLQGLQNVLDAEPKTADLTLDLQEVRLVYREGVRFLATCKAKGIKLKNCPAYIRELLGIGRETGDEHS
jgi:esterase/lipase superfamily enzyme